MGRLFWKFFVAFWVAIAITAAGAGTAVWLQRQAREAPEAGKGPPRMPIEEMAGAMLEHGGHAALREWMADVNRVRPMRLFVVDHEGRDIIGRPVPPEALTRARERLSDPLEPREGRGPRLVNTPAGQQFLVFVGPQTETRDGRRRGPRQPSPLTLLVIGIFTSLAASALLAWYLASPIRNLRWAFGAVARGQLDTRVTPLMGSRRDEIADLGREFDRMSQQLEGLVAGHKRLLHDVSHELRSPLARLQAAIGLARQSPDKLDSSLERIEREAVRLDRLLGEVLTLARLETATGTQAGESVDFGEIVAAAVEDARFEAEAQGKRVDFQGRVDAAMQGKPELLHSAVENVVRNAIKFAPAGSAIDVALRTIENPRRVRLEVRDRGPGVREEHLARIFEPFFRGEPAAGENGYGLGLAIARRAIETHGGSIRAHNADGGGLSVEIELPLAVATPG
jgi:two-component system OmpR family sensor kinase